MFNFKNFKNLETKHYIIALVYFFIMIILIGMIYRDKLTEYLDNNWKTVRCYPHVMPIAFLSNKAEGSNIFDKTSTNFVKCNTLIISQIIKIFTLPLMGVIKGLSSSFKSITGLLDKFRNMATILRNMFKVLVENIVERISNSHAAVIYLQEKIKNMIKKQTAIFEVIKHFLSSFPMLLYSFSHGPIPRFTTWLTRYIGLLITIIIFCLACSFGGLFVKLATCPVCAICFDENTEIWEDEENKIQLKNIKLLQDTRGGKVLGIIKIDNINEDLFNYNGIIVSGSHLILENAKWIRIEDSAIPEKYTEISNLVCLITSNHKIYIQDLIFSDYKETDDTDINKLINNAVTNACNNNFTQFENTSLNNLTYYWGFSSNTLIRINNTWNTIKNIVEKRSIDNNIKGHVVLDGNKINLYNYKGVIVSGNTLVLHNNIWKRVANIKAAINVSFQTVIYNLVSVSDIVEIRANDNTILQFRDFREHSGEKLNNDIDKLVENRLNNKL